MAIHAMMAIHATQQKGSEPPFPYKVYTVHCVYWWRVGQANQNRCDLLSDQSKKLSSKQSEFCYETVDHNSEGLSHLAHPCHRGGQKVRKIQRSRNFTGLPKPPLARAVQWVIFQWFKEFGRGIMWNKTFVHNYMETWNPCPHHQEDLNWQITKWPEILGLLKVVNSNQLKPGSLNDLKLGWGWGTWPDQLPMHFTEMQELVQINAYYKDLGIHL